MRYAPCVPWFLELEGPPVPAVTVPKNVQQVVDECVTRFDDNLACALWHGSRARGEATAASDDDLILIFHRIDDGVLLGLREIFLRPELDTWSAYVLSVDELRAYPRDGRLQFHYGHRVLHGHFDPPPLNRDNLLADLRAIAREIRSYCRHPFLHHALAQHQPDTVRTAHLMYYMAKNAVTAMKARHLLHHGHFPETRAELRPLIEDPRECQIIDWVEHWHAIRPTFEADPTPLMLHLDAFARRLLESLHEELGSRN
jgi:hypothetical protein